MGEVRWTESQLQAIEARGGSLLVSAAAGSGKTAVLVERIMRMLTDSENPVSVNELLVVTFTKAAASQMKNKIAKSLSAALHDDPENPVLLKNQLLLPLSRICTIDSFCAGLVRDNFHMLGISPDFSMLDGSRKAILMNEAITRVIEKYYSEDSGNFALLRNFICGANSDDNLIKNIFRLYDVVNSYPFPDERLERMVEVYRNPEPVAKSSHGRVVIGYAVKVLRYCASLTGRAIELCNGDEQLKGKLGGLLFEENAFYLKLLDLLEKGDWESAGENAVFGFDRFPIIKKPDNPELKDYVKALRDEAKRRYEEVGGLLSRSQQSIDEEAKTLLPAVECLAGMVRDFDREYTALKSRENCVDFSDTLHFAIKILSGRDENGNVVPSQTAVELSKTYKHIFIDEYQDVNEAQELVFNLVSRNGENLFMVGDVKQSIYGFRQAMPELFIKKQKEFSKFGEGKFPAKIILSKNFRSRSGITENVNRIFSRLMTQGVGGLVYNEEHFLNYNEDGYAPHSEPDNELVLLSFDKGDDYSAAQAEAKYAADYIAENVGRLEIKDGDTLRPARYGDFCVLLRSDGAAGELNIFAKELESRKFPVVCEKKEKFFETPEIRFMLSVLKIINSPGDDVALLAVMLSPVYGFSPDDLAVIRTEPLAAGTGHRVSLWHRVINYSKNGKNISLSEKCAGFAEIIENFHKLSMSIPVSRLIRTLLDETGYMCIAGTMGRGEARRKNLNTLADYANSYEQYGRSGLRGFLSYVERVSDNGADTVESSTGRDSSDSVKVMTIHKSKGLEFPVCILARCARKMNDDDERERAVISRECGIGMDIVTENFVKYPSWFKIAAKLEKREASRAEELRVLYVALTRAKEKLIIIHSSPEEQDETAVFGNIDMLGNPAIDPVCVLKSGSYSELLLSALATNPDAVCLRGNGFDYIESDFSAPKLRVRSVKIENGDLVESEQEKAEEDYSGILSEIRKRLSFVYPYKELETITSKRVASDFAKAHSERDYIASSLPAFMCRDKLTPAQRGTATHRFMELCSFENSDLASQLESLVENGKFTRQEADAVDIEKVSAFFDSSLFERIGKADRVYREECFTCSVTAGEIDPGIRGENALEPVIIDGTVDCAFEENGELVVIDYKTDRGVTAEKLAEMYSGQLEIYRKCLSRKLLMPVKQAFIYSFSLGRAIEIKDK